VKIFILEDSINRIQLFREILYADVEVDMADDLNEAKRKFNPPYDLILLDHDLSHEDYMDFGREQNNGTEFAKWMAHFNPVCPVIIHSYNPAGAERMAASLTAAGWRVTLQPFGLKLLDQLREMVAPK
jgi:DNA-binding response OmpR family regulator